MTLDFIVVLITAPTAADARHIARVLVDERLAACVNVLPGCESVYRWEGKVVEESEAMMVVKTAREQFPELARRVAEIHPHAVPEVIGLPLVEVAERYRLFLSDSVPRRARRE
jgi:periplasmic divalent cation tolerance protein